MEMRIMKTIKKILLFSLLLFVFFGSAQNSYAKTITKDLEVQTKDARIIKAQVSYVKIEGVKKYPTVVLLHSLGYSSADWANLIPELNNAGYAVIAIDLRGHGKSVFNTKFQKRAWTYFTPKNYQKFPSDVLLVLDQAKKQEKVVSLDNMAIVGADIGANTAVLVAKDLKKKPKTLVLISPTSNFKGLYIPIALVEMGGVPILSMVSNKDGYCLKEQKDLAKYAQGGFYAKNYPQGGMGMMMLKSNPSMSQDITRWIIRYLK